MGRRIRYRVATGAVRDDRGRKRRAVKVAIEAKGINSLRIESRSSSTARRDGRAKHHTVVLVLIRVAMQVLPTSKVTDRHAQVHALIPCSHLVVQRVVPVAGAHESRHEERFVLVPLLGDLIVVDVQVEGVEAKIISFELDDRV